MSIEDDETSEGYLENANLSHIDEEKENETLTHYVQRQQRIVFAFNSPKKKISHESSFDSSDSHLFQDMPTDDDILLTSD